MNDLLKLFLFLYFITSTKEDTCKINEISINALGTYCVDIDDFLEKEDLQIETDNLLYLASNNEGKIIKNNYKIEIFKLSDEKLQSFNIKKSNIYLPSKCLTALEEDEKIKLDKSQGIIILSYNYNKINRNNIPDIFFTIRHNGPNSQTKFINSKYFDLSICHEDPIMVDEEIKIEDLKYDLYDDPSPIDIEKIKYAKKLKIDLFDPHSQFLNDICFKFTSENKTDVTLDSRLEDYYQNITLCNESLNSHYIGFNYSDEDKTLKYRCSYGFYRNEEEKESYLDNIDKQMKFLFSTSNIKIITCYEQLFNIKNLVYNYGGIIVILVILIQIIFYIIFCCKGTKSLEEKVKQLFESAQEKPIKFESSHDNNINAITTNNEGYTENRLYSQNNRNNEIRINDVEIINKDINIRNANSNSYEKKEDLPKYKNNKNNYANPQKRNAQKAPITNSGNAELIVKDIDEKDIEENKPHKTNIMDKKDKKGEKNSEKNSEKSSISQIYVLSNDEKNELTYERALRYDDRGFCHYYCVILKMGHIILSVFCRCDDYNIFTMKLGLLLMTFPINLTFNIFFFTSKSIKLAYTSKLEDIDIWKLANNYVNTFVSSILSVTFLVLLKFICLTHNSIRGLRKIKSVKKAQKKWKWILKCIKFRINLYFILSFLFLIIFGYYIACFCAIFENAQIELIKSMFTSWFMSLIYPFLIHFITSIFRRLALRCKCKCAYRINQILQLI